MKISERSSNESKLYVMNQSVSGLPVKNRKTIINTCWTFSKNLYGDLSTAVTYSFGE